MSVFAFSRLPFFFVSEPMRRFSLFISFLILFSAVQAQEGYRDTAMMQQMDSLLVEYERQKQQEKVEAAIRQYEQARLKKEMSFGTDGVLPLARGLLLSWTDHGYITRTAHFESKGDGCNWTDYAVGGAPLVANWVMKAAGVKSRSKVERMLTANAMALGLSFGMSETLKHTVREGRPDQSDLHAFPSGHASFAFVSASILSREYGYHSPWITVGSYATATGTQLLRAKHNKHWMNDLYMGAGIGMVSTNLAYFLTDRIFGADGVNKPEVRRRDVLRLMKFNTQPSGFTLISGTEIGNRKIHFGDATLKSGAALTAGFDLSCHMTPHVAIELMTRIVDAQMKAFGTSRPFTGDHLDIYHFDLAAQYSYPISLDKRMGTRAFVGTRTMSGASLTDGTITYTIPKETKPECGLGLTFHSLDTDNYVWGFTADYYHTFSHYMKNRYSICSVWKILF